MEQQPSKRQRLHLFRLLAAATVILLCSGLSWAAPAPSTAPSYDEDNEYRTIDAFIQRLQAKIDCSDANQWTSLSTTLNSLQTEVETGYEQGTLTSEDIAGLDARLQQIIGDFISSTTIKAGDDLTLLIQNADFSIGDGMNLTGTAIPGWNIISGSIKELSANYHNIEAYHRTFNIQQTLTYNLPAGTYRITVQGFVRIDNGKNSMVLYAGASERLFKLITDESSEVQICSDGTGSTAWPYDRRNTVLGGYLPYSMQGASMYFETINPATNQPYYLNDVTISHLGGELTIGVKCDDTGLWILWDNFTLTYVDDNPLAPFFDDIDAFAAQLKALADNYQTLPDELSEPYTAVMARVDNKASITSVDDAIALRDDLKVVIDLFNKYGPYVCITGSDDAKTLTFYYGMPTSDALELADYYSNISERAWNDEAANIQKVVFDPSFADYKPTSTRVWFYDMTNLTAIEGIENLNTSNVTDMGWMFYGCQNLASLDVSNFDTSNVEYMNSMFCRCQRLTSLNVRNFDTNKVTSMSWMFGYCNSLTSLDVSNFDTSNVKNMYGMFAGCSGLTSLDVSDFNTGNVTDMYAMFRDCSGLSSLDVSNFDTGNVTDMDYMFSGCSGLSSLDVSNFDTRKVTSMIQMFYNCSSLTNLDLSNFDTGNVTDMSYMFRDCSGLTSLDVSNFDTSKVTDMRSMFYNCSGLTSLVISNFDTSNVTDARWLFYGCSGLTSLDVSNFDTKKVTNMYSMFNGCSGLTSLDVSNFDTGNVTDMRYMFYNCYSLTSLDLGNFNTSNVTDMGYMFYKCYSLTTLDVGNFNTSDVSAMTSMFYNCSGLISLDVSNFDTSKVTDMRWMFSYCSSLITIYVGDDWCTEAVEDGNWMFAGCTHLVGGQGTSYSNNYIDYTYAHIDGGAANPGYFTAASSAVLAGDANCDGVVDAADVTVLVDFIVGKTILTTVQKTNADMTGDGKITISDLTSLLKLCPQQ